MKMIQSVLAVAAITFLSAGLAQAQVDSHGGPCGPGTGHACVIPEVDPSMAAGALALVGGAVMIVRGRRKA